MKKKVDDGSGVEKDNEAQSQKDKPDKDEKKPNSELNKENKVDPKESVTKTAN